MSPKKYRPNRNQRATGVSAARFCACTDLECVKDGMERGVLHGLLELFDGHSWRRLDGWRVGRLEGWEWCGVIPFLQFCITYMLQSPEDSQFIISEAEKRGGTPNGF